MLAQLLNSKRMKVQVLLIVMRQSWPEKKNDKPILLINIGTNPRNVCEQTVEKVLMS